MTLRLITAPTALAVSLVEAKANIHVFLPDEDHVIERMIASATEAAEHEAGRAIMPQTWEAGFDVFPASFKLTRVPVQTVESITYTDTLGAVQTIAPSLYRLIQDDFGGAQIIPSFGNFWPAHRNEIDGIKIRFVAGYADAASVPEGIKSWILLAVGTLDKNRESEVIERGVQIKLGLHDRLLDRYRVYG